MFEGHPGLVELDHSSPAVLAFVVEVMRLWLDRAADGWRLDAAYAVAPPFWRQVRSRCHRTAGWCSTERRAHGPFGTGNYIGSVTARWLVVVVAAAALVLTPVLVAARPASESDITAVDLAARITDSTEVGWSGSVETIGSLQVPDSDSFAGLVQLLGERNQLRAWWRGTEDWRVDQIRSTGETDLFRTGFTMMRWEFESETATISPVSTIRLPDSSDLLPPTLARSMLQGVRADELERLPARRVAGLDAPGVRLVPADPATTVGHVDIWADAATGLPVRVQLYGLADSRPVLSTELRDVDLGVPDAAITRFVPGAGVRVEYQEATDVAAAANALAPYDLPATLGGLDSRSGVDPGAVAVYGRGPTTLFALPLRGQVAGPLRDRLRESAAVQASPLGLLLPVGPITLLITHRDRRGSVLLAGTVSEATMRRAATELAALR